MTNYKIQYWLYACLNKKFGSEVKLKRDSLHSIYDVNRHVFEVSTNTLNLKTVKTWLSNKLNECEYALEELGNTSYFQKNINGKKYYISLNEQNRGTDWTNKNHNTLIMSIHSYKN
jgi:hypothetical protein